MSAFANQRRRNNDYSNIRLRGQGSHENDQDNDIRLQKAAPLADKLRPKTVEQVVGQDHLTTGPDALLRLDSDTLVTTESIIVWGPPG
jgi:putative ATPase